MDTELKMTIKEADRFAVMKQIEEGKKTIMTAAEELGVCYRHARRLWQGYQGSGPKALISKRRGKPSNHRLPQEVKDQAIKIVKTRYADYGPTLVSEKLEEKHNLRLSRETIRQLMIQEGLWRPQKKRKRKIYARRTRRSCKGELEQIDGSYEYWFEDRADKCCLLVCVDDATSELMMLRFCRTETTDDYFALVKSYVERYGRPQAFYSDRHSIFRVNNADREVGKHLTLFHQALKRLDIKLICAHSPQAKGRVERANGILQDRLIKELREQNISSIEAGNRYLERFRKSYNKKFGKEPADKKNAHRDLLRSHNLDELLVERHERVISKDLSFSFLGGIYQIDSNLYNRLQGKRIEIYAKEREIKFVELNGGKIKYKKWQEHATDRAQIVDAKELEVLWPTRKRKIGRHHPWR